MLVEAISIYQMRCRSIDRNSLIYRRGWLLKCFDPIGSEKLQKAGSALYNSPKVQSFLRDSMVWDLGIPAPGEFLVSTDPPAWELGPCTASAGLTA